jgi:CDP-glycerol glycerophosphotransferase (TagB/SpsB family)
LKRYIEEDDQCYKYKKAHMKFLYGFLPRLYKKLGIECVISPHHRYLQDVDWGSVSKKIGIPYILISRECRFTASTVLKNEMINVLKRLVKFEGSYMIVQGELDRQIIIECDYVTADKISSLGCMRMDGFLRRIKTVRSTISSRKKIVFFPFNLKRIMHATSAQEKSAMSQFFVDVNVLLARLAINYPEIDVIMKPKSKRATWNKEVDVVFKESGIYQHEIPNLHIEPYLDVQDLVLDADVFCGLNTSALLEAAVAEKPVIIPYFKEIRKTIFEEMAFFKESYHLFDIAESIEDLESMILNRLKNPTIDREIMEGREAMFVRYVSSLNCDATEKHVSLIKRVVAEGSNKHLKIP